MKQKIVSCVLILTFLLVAFVLNVAEKSASLITISALESAALIEKNKNNPDFIILDVRTAEEYDAVRLIDAEMLDFHSATFTDALKELDKEKTYLIYCRSRVRSKKILRLMEEMGFEMGYHMLGGILAWQAENFPTI